MRVRAGLALSAITAAAIAAGTAHGSTIGVAGGGWSWFGDPRAIVRGDSLFLGWITSGGNVEVGRMNLRTGGWAQGRLRSHINIDDHSNPSLAELPDGRLIAFYSPHSGRLTASSHMWYRVAKRPGGVIDWGPERVIPTNTRGGLGFTYPNPVWVGHTLYLFWRGGNWNPAFSRTTNLRSWAPARQLLRGIRGQRPYIKFDSFGHTIRFAYTGSHPDSRATDLYFGKLGGRYVESAGGRRLWSRRNLPFDYTRGERVYRAKTAGAAWIWDIGHTKDGNPVLVYTTIQSREQHTYRYARWTGHKWYDRALAKAGPAIDHDPGYSGGITLDHDDPNIVFMSRFTDGHFEIERWQTHDAGHTWETQALTTNSARDNIRPVVPRGASGDRVLLWNWGRYETFTDFSDLTVMLRTQLPPPAQTRWHLHRTRPDTP
jgi:putative BNR repeat neuraminidase